LEKGEVSRNEEKWEIWKKADLVFIQCPPFWKALCAGIAGRVHSGMGDVTNKIAIAEWV